MGFIDVTPEAGQRFFSQPTEGPVVMLNLLRFRIEADYSAAKNLAPETPISGWDAYKRYMEHAKPFITKAGSELLFSGTGGHALIGPFEERWDYVLLVRHQSTQAFLAFASDEAYLAGMGHRTAALEDSRLIPMQL